MKACLVVPHFDHLDQFRDFLPRLLGFGLPLVIVDDASPPPVAEGIASLLEEQAPAAMLVRHDYNQGKGGAVMTGLRTAHAAGFTHALQIDADGQHDAGDIATFLAHGQSHPDCLICGEPQFGDDISTLRYYARYITLSFCWLETLSTEIHDPLCGFRLYPLAATVAILDDCNPGKRMAFDPEILVRAIWSGMRLYFVPVRVVYPAGGRSHFHYVRDNIEIAWMHTRLVAGMLLRVPRLLRFRRRRLQDKAPT